MVHSTSVPQRRLRASRKCPAGQCACLALIGLCVSSAFSTCSAHEVAWAIQLSDLHLSVFNKYWLPQYGDKEGDLHLFANKILPHLQPGAIIMGGDLVDAKTLKMQGQQYKEEWQMYRAVIEDFKDKAGLPEEAMRDVRGNHDAFDVPDRNLDWFGQYAAQGRRNSSSRVTAFPLYAQHDEERAGLCAAAVLVGLDVSPQPGLRGPTNFAGLCGPALLQELDTVLNAAETNYRAEGCSPVFLAYGHHPLSTILHPEIPFWRQIDRASPLTIYGKLSQHGVQAHVNGHLHSVFGQRLHKMHRSYAPGRLLEMETAAWKDDRRFRLLTIDNGTLSFTDLMFNTPGKPVTKGVVAPLNPIPPQNFTVSGIDADVAASRFIVALTSPPDARYSPLTRAPSGNSPPTVFEQVRALVFPITSETEIAKVEVQWRCEEAKLEGSISMKRQEGPAPLYAAPWNAKVSCGPPKPAAGTHVIMLQVVVSEADGQQSRSEMRQVALKSAKTGTSQLVTPKKHLPLGVTRLENFMLWLDWTRTFNKLFMIQCFVHLVCMLLLPKALRKFITPDDPHSIHSTSHRAPLANSPAANGPLEVSHRAPAANRLSVDSHTGAVANSPLEVGHMGAARNSPAANSPLMGSYTGPAINSPPHSNHMAAAANSLATLLPAQEQHQPQQQAASSTRGKEVNGQGGALALVTWAPTVLCDMAAVPQIWWPLVLYSVYVPFGPWFAARLLSSQPLGFYLSQGVLLSPNAETSWRWLPCADTLILANRFTFFTMLPGTLWLAGVVSDWTRGRSLRPASSGHGQQKVGFTITQLIALGLLLAFHGQTLYRLRNAYGLSCVILNPVMVWCIPVVVCQLVWLRYARTGLSVRHAQHNKQQ